MVGASSEPAARHAIHQIEGNADQVWAEVAQMLLGFDQLWVWPEQLREGIEPSRFGSSNLGLRFDQLRARFDQISAPVDKNRGAFHQLLAVFARLGLGSTGSESGLCSPPGAEDNCSGRLMAKQSGACCSSSASSPAGLLSLPAIFHLHIVSVARTRDRLERPSERRLWSVS